MAVSRYASWFPPAAGNAGRGVLIYFTEIVTKLVDENLDRVVVF